MLTNHFDDNHPHALLNLKQKCCKGRIFGDNSGIIFIVLHKKYIYCGYLLEVPQRGTSNEYPQYMYFMEDYKLSPNAHP